MTKRMKFRMEIDEEQREIKAHSWILILRIKAILNKNKYEDDKCSRCGKT